MRVISFTHNPKVEDVNDLMYKVFEHTKTVPNDWDLFWMCSVGGNEFYMIAEYFPLRYEVRELMEKQGYESYVIQEVLANVEWDRSL